MGFNPERGDKLYNKRNIVTLTADGQAWLRTDQVDPGFVLEVHKMTAYGNNSGAGESVDLGYTHLNTDNYLYGVLSTGAVDYRVSMPGKLYLGEGQQPMAHFEAGNDTEVLTLLVNGILKKLHR